MLSLMSRSLIHVVALCTAGSKMVTQMMVQKHLIAHYRRLEKVKRKLFNCYLLTCAWTQNFVSVDCG